ncbi:MAG: PhnD/SsuA/transferrin family substrate-binding protein [Sideroxydans sp.]|nr:PhnD/SsuA/transferrin family substrate-binding protein [Sideroxydans sp.]
MKSKSKNHQKLEHWRGRSTLARIKYLAISLATVVALLFYASTFSEPVLRVSLVPDDTPSVLRRKFKPLSDYLEKRIGMKVEFRPALDADALIDDLIRNKLDLVWIDGANLIQAKARSNKQVIPIVQFEVDDKRLSVLINKHNYDDYRWMVRTDMDVNLRLKLIDAFLALDKNNALDNEILSLQNTSKFIATSD